MKVLVSWNEWVDYVTIVKGTSYIPWVRNLYNTYIIIMITYEAFDGWKPIVFSHQGLTYVRCCYHQMSCFDHHLWGGQIEFHVPRLVTLRAWTDSKDNLLKFFNHGEHMHCWVSISVQFSINHIRIDVCCCIVVMTTWERSCNTVLIVATLHSGFPAFSPQYCSDPFQELNEQWLDEI